MPAELVVTYQAREQFNRLSPQEQADLTRVLSEPEKLKPARMTGHSGRFVSRFGKDKRVYWEESDDGKLVVLSVVAA